MSKSAYSTLLLLALLVALPESPLYASKNQEALQKEAIRSYYLKHYEKTIEILEKSAPGLLTESKYLFYYNAARSRQFNARLWLDRAEAMLAQFRYNDARQAIDTAEKIAPYLEKISRLRQEVERAQKNARPLAHLTTEEQGRFQETLKMAEQSLAEGRNDSALELYSRLLNLAPADPRAAEGIVEAQKRYQALLSRDKIEQLIREAEQYYQKHELLKSLVTYESVLQLDPANTPIREKISLLKNLIEKEKEENQKKTLAMEYLAAGNNHRKQGEYDQAIESYETGRHIHASVTDWEKLISLARQEKARAEEAKFQKGLELIEKNFQAGLIAVAAEKFQEAIASFEKVIQIAEEYNQSMTKKQAEDLLQKSRESLQRKESERVTPESPYYDLVETLLALGLARYEAEDFVSAQKYFARILELFPQNKVANLYYISCNIRLNPARKDEIIDQIIAEIEASMKSNKAEARRLYTLLESVDPQNPKVKQIAAKLEPEEKIIKKSTVAPAVLKNWYDQALALAQSEPAKSMELLNNILKEDPTYGKARTLLAQIEGRLSRGNWAKSDKPASGSAHAAYSAGILHYNNGRIEEALKSFKEALRQDPDYSKARIAMEKCQNYLNTR